MPERHGAADSGPDESSSAVNGSSVHFESGEAEKEASVNQVSDMEEEEEEFQDDGKFGDDAGKDEFVDASEELNADNRESALVLESEPALEGKSSSSSKSSGRMENGELDDDLMAEIRRLQGLLEKTVSEKESAEKYYEEERGRHTREINELWHQIKGLVKQCELGENGDVFPDHHNVMENGDGNGELDVSMTSLDNMIKHCSKLIGDALEVRSHTEGSVRELHATLSTKDQQIEELNSKIAELSADQGVKFENDQLLDFATRRLLDSLAFVGESEELVDDSIDQRMDLIERRTMALIEKYSQIYYQIDQLRHYLPEAGEELLPDELVNVVSGACNELFEAKRKESDLVEKLRTMEAEYEKLVEQLKKETGALEVRNEEVDRVRAELEQEKMRLGSVKEKLSMAVTKGKSLVQQRESLKQSLAEKTSELERFKIDLQEKSSALEAAEATIEELRHQESLVTLLQENLSQRHAILIKLEEVLSEASLPEDILSRDITEKCRWIVDERNALKDISVEYQKCREALSVLELPESMSPSDTETVAVWLRDSFYQAKNEKEALLAEVSSAKESAHTEIDRLSTSLSAVLQEKDHHESELNDLKLRYEEIVEKSKEALAEKEQLAMLLVEKAEVAVGDSGLDYQGMSFSDYVTLFNRCLEKMRENTVAIPADCSSELDSFEKLKSLLYERDLDLVLSERILEEEMLATRDEINNMSKEYKTLSGELSALKEARGSLQKDLERSEEKSGMLREKLSMAVKKGKGLVQDRENLKHQLDEKNEEIEKLKNEIQQQESAVSNYRDEISRMSSLVERVPVMESNIASMTDQNDKLEQLLVEINNMLQRVMESVETLEVPLDLVAGEPLEKIKWFGNNFIECRSARDSLGQELVKAREEIGNLTARLAETVAAVSNMQMMEDDFEKVKRECSNLTSQLREAQGTIKTLEDELSVAQSSISQLAEEKREIEAAKMKAELDLQDALQDASSLASSYAEVSALKKSLEDALSKAESEISVLLSENEAARASGGDRETEREKMVEEISIQNSKLAEAHETIKSLEETVSELHASVSELSESRASLVDELNKIRDETGSRDSSIADAYAKIKLLEVSLSNAENNISLVENEHKMAKQEISELKSQLEDASVNMKSLESALSAAENRTSVLENENKIANQEISELVSKLTDAHTDIKSLQGALSEAENSISVLENENKTANQEISELKLKINGCLEELAGKSGSLESRSLELVGHLNQLEVLMKDESFASAMKEDFEEKFERLKDMDTILNRMMNDLSCKNSEQTEDEQGGSFLGQSGNLGDSLKFDAETAPVRTVYGDDISLSFKSSMDGLQRKNKILEDKFGEFSILLDDCLSVLLRKLQSRRDEVKFMVDEMESLKQNVKSLEAHKTEQENAMSMLEHAVTFLLSACGDVRKELQFEAENSLLSYVYLPEIEIEEISGIDIGEHRKTLDSTKYVKPVEDLLLSVSRVKALVKQFEATSKAAASKMEDMENELKETREVSQKALKEGDLKQNMIYELEKDVEALEKSCSALKLKIEDYQADIEKLKEREAEVSSMYRELSIKQQDSADSLLSSSEWRALAEKIDGFEIPSAESGRETIAHSSHAEKLFNIVDGFTQLQNQVDLLMQDKEELQSDIAAKVLEIQHLKDEAELYNTQYSEKSKHELFELISGLEKMASMLGISEIPEGQKVVGASELLATLEKHMKYVIMEFEATKSKAQELGSKLLGSQKVIDELSTKVKVLEGSAQGRSIQPEVIQDRGIYEATTGPSGSEISEIEDVDLSGKSLVPPVPSAAHVRTMRKGSTDHLALSIDTESQQLINGETDDEKGHKFKSLNTSGLIPKQGKLLADRIDGICVNGGRVLMTRPGARLGVIAYWLFLHIWLLGTLL